MKLDIDKTLTGVAGEYFVAAELTIRKVVAAITLRNSRGIDIVASNEEGNRSLSIQVKSNSEGKATWAVNAKSETFFSDAHFYVFVALKPLGERPNFYIVPSKTVAETIHKSHRDWLSEPKKDGSARKDTPMRKFSDTQGEFLERWDLLKGSLK